MFYVRETKPNVFVPQDPNEPLSVSQNGEPVVVHPPAVWKTWTKTQQEEVGLFEYEPFKPLPGKVAHGNRRFQRVNGVIKEAYDAVSDVVPEFISRRQLLIALWRLNFITQQEALAAAQTGAVPVNLQVEFDKLEEPQRTSACISFAAMANCYRNDPLLATIAASKGFSNEQMDSWFRMAAEL